MLVLNSSHGTSVLSVKGWFPEATHICQQSVVFMSGFITVFCHTDPPAHMYMITGVHFSTHAAKKWLNPVSVLLRVLFLRHWRGVCVVGLQRAFVSAGYLLVACLRDNSVTSREMQRRQFVACALLLWHCRGFVTCIIPAGRRRPCLRCLATMLRFWVTASVGIWWEPIMG